ncbi:uncharacterized protein LOC132642793 [Lycium barbarum]|uniref:uncharacterized protein LOC132642793 n=1 Tax=Lycium barbarum TaxID=112863 RepID=UPI00293F6FCC|nr:uncharacterized protein LOC132642793 [Lycium barbarum]
MAPEKNEACLARRRELYKLMTLEKKEACLAQQRANKAKIKKQCLHDNSVLANSVNPSSFEVSTSFAEQASSVVRRSLLLGETGSSSGTKPTHHGKKSVITTNQESSSSTKPTHHGKKSVMTTNEGWFQPFH